MQQNSRHQTTLKNQRRIDSLTYFEKFEDEKKKKAREAFHHRAFEGVKKNGKTEEDPDAV